MLDLLIFIWELIGIITGIFILVAIILVIIICLLTPIISKTEDELNK